MTCPDGCSAVPTGHAVLKATAAARHRDRHVAEEGTAEDLEGTVSAEGLVRLFDGEHPGTGEPLSAAIPFLVSGIEHWSGRSITTD